MKIVLFSNKHRSDDNRVVELEAVRLAEQGQDVVVYAQDKDVHAEYQNITIKQCKDKLWECYSQCIQENGDIYIFHDPGLLLCAVRLQKKGEICIFDSHENYEEKLKTRIPNRLPVLRPIRKPIAKAWWIYEQFCVNQLSGKICADRTVLAKYGNKTFLLPNLPSKEFYSNLPDRTVDEGNHYIIYVGTLSWDRGIIEAAEAVQICKHPNVQLQIIGDTKDEKLKQKLKSYPNVVWNGRIEWKKLKDYLVNADIGIVLLQPTEAYYYCPGENIVKLWEYMSVGLPVLLSDFPGLRKLNEELRFGLTVKPDDIQEIANKIDWLLDNPEVRKQMGINGRTVVSEKYNAEKYAAKFLSFLEKTLSEK